MTQDDERDLASLWAQAPDPGEQAELEALARRATFRARLTQYGELVASVLALAALGAMLFLRPQPAILVTGGIIVVALVWSSWRRHTLGNIALLAGEGDGEAFAARAIEAKAAELQRSTLGLVLIVPGTLLGLLLIFLWRGDLDDFRDFLLAPLATLRGVAAMLLLLAALGLLVRSNMRLRRELARLREVFSEYREENRRDREAEG